MIESIQLNAQTFPLIKKWIYLEWLAKAKVPRSILPSSLFMATSKNLDMFPEEPFFFFL